MTQQDQRTPFPPPSVILFEFTRSRTLSAVPMDFNSLKEQVSNLTLYDLKAGVRKVQNGK